MDTTRLAEVAVWPRAAGGPGAAELAARLRPPAPAPVVVGDGELTAELTAELSTPEDVVMVSVRLVPVAGAGAGPIGTAGGPVTGVAFGPVETGRRDYRAEVTGCADGCRLAGLVLTLTASGLPAGVIDEMGLTVHALRLDGTDALGADRLADPDRWRGPETGPTAGSTMIRAGDGLAWTVIAPVPGLDYVVSPVDAPHPLPVVTAGRPPPGSLVANVDGGQLRVVEVARLAALPGVGASGTLMDLEYAERNALEPGARREAEVWLAPDAPDSLVERLREAGVNVRDERTLTGVLAAADRSGAALALRFFLIAAGVAGLVGLLALAVVAAVDRRSGSRGLRDLRAQGVGDRTVTRAGVWACGAVVLAAAVGGAVAVGAAWLATGDRLPLGVERSAVPAWPEWTAVVPPGTVVVGLLLVAGVVAGWWQRPRVAPMVRARYDRGHRTREGSTR